MYITFKSFEFSLNIFSLNSPFSDKNNIIFKKRIDVFKPAIHCVRNQLYLNPRKAQETESIFKLTLFHVSVIWQIPWSHWISVPFRENFPFITFGAAGSSGACGASWESKSSSVANKFPREFLRSVLLGWFFWWWWWFSFVFSPFLLVVVYVSFFFFTLKLRHVFKVRLHLAFFSPFFSPLKNGFNRIQWRCLDMTSERSKVPPTKTGWKTLCVNKA